MLFNSYLFIFVFLPLALVGFYNFKNKHQQLVFLLISSLIFYSYWSFKYVFLLLFTVVLDFFIAKKIATCSDQKTRKSLLWISIGTNLSILFTFKYFNFFMGLMPANQISLNLILPIGISFYTFQSMSYVIDVYRKKAKVHGELLPFASYVTLFPHQISGPLVRHDLIVPQLENDTTYRFEYSNFYSGLAQFILGLSKKVLIADQIAHAIDPLIHQMSQISNTEAWLAMIGYTVQLYFDFSGYSDMAIGLGRMMNIEFPINFNSPYQSKSITEFWQRWHISLSSWLKDYLYISLGGNRNGKIKTYRNLFLTMLLGGLWHGANITFVIWGVYHGLILVFEKLFGLEQTSKHTRAFVTFFMINIGWIFFRSPDLKTAKLWLQKIFLMSEFYNFEVLHLITKYKDRFYFALIAGLVIIFYCQNTNKIHERINQKYYVFLLSILFCLSLMFMVDESPFLYFQF